MRSMKALLILAGAAALECGCASTPALLRAPQLEPLAIQGAVPPPALAEDHFKRDRQGAIEEENLRAILDAPVLLDETQRLGVLPVAGSYRPDLDVPIPTVPAELARSLDAAGVFQATSEISTDWPADHDLPGLRELAARYRSGYLLLYRHRFVDDDSANGWCWLYPTLIGAIVAPSRTLETAGVLEATLFDVRTGTLLFTVYERVRATSDETPWNNGQKMRQMKMRLLQQAGEKLASQVVAKVRHLVALKASRKEAVTARAVPSS